MYRTVWTWSRESNLTILYSEHFIQANLIKNIVWLRGRGMNFIRRLHASIFYIIM